MKVLKNNPWCALGLVGALFACMTAFAANACQGGGISMRFDLSKTNNPGITNENTYIVVLGTNPATGKRAYVQFNNDKELGKPVDITNTGMNGKDFAVPLSAVTSNGDMAGVCLPKLSAGRIYLSFGNPLDMPTENDLSPRHPDVNNPITTTNGTLFDKIEFTYLPQGISYINPTGVDFLAIPYTIKQAGVEYGHYGDLESLIHNMKTIVCKAADVNVGSTQCTQKWKDSEWSSLVVYNDQNELLRVDAPGRSGDKFNTYFSGYLTDLSKYYSSSTNRSIKIDLRELNKGIWSGSFTPNTQTLVFKRDGGSSSETVSYTLNDIGNESAIAQNPQVGPIYTANSIFMGAQAPFGGNAISDTISRDLTAAIVSGMLMRTEEAFIGKDFFDEDGNPVFKNREQMQHLTEFYFDNVEGSVDYNSNQCGKSKDAPCINVYSEAVHALTTDTHVDHPQASFHNSYAFAYDDFLGMDGTNVQSDKEPATIVIGDMKDRKIPHLK